MGLNGQDDNGLTMHGKHIEHLEEVFNLAIKFKIGPSRVSPLSPCTQCRFIVAIYKLATQTCNGVSTHPQSYKSNTPLKDNFCKQACKPVLYIAVILLVAVVPQDVEMHLQSMIAHLAKVSNFRALL